MSSKEIALDLAQFLDSEQARGLTGVKAGEVRRVVEAFLGACYQDLGNPPRLLDGEGLRQVFEHALPARLELKDSVAPQLERVLGAYLDHLHESQVVTAAFEQRLALDRCAAELAARVASGQNRARHVPSKQAPVVHRAEKIGRNDPCFCGSGKKFKKCHGNQGAP